MIIDDLTHLEDYVRIIPTLGTVIEFLNDHDLSVLPDGHIDLDAAGHYVNLQTIAAKTSAQAVLESHRKMIDIQVPLTGDEVMGYSSRADLTPAPYDEAKDISFHPGHPASFVTVKKGMFAIFFPQDGHAPGITPTALKKAIFKIPVPDK